MSDPDLYTVLADYTLSHPSPEFIHQYIVDAYAAQTAKESDKPIKLAFALIGLYLHLEKGFTGKQVQNAHLVLAKKRKDWPKFELPKERGEITIKDVLAISPGQQRDQRIEDWMRSVWEEYKNVHQQIKDLVQLEL